MSYQQSIISRFEENVARYGAKPFLKLQLPAEKGEISYQAMLVLARRCSTHLANHSTEAGGVVLIFLPQSALALGYFLGAMMAGFVPSFMPCPSEKQEPRHYWQSHKSLFETIRPTIVVASAAQAIDMEQFGLSSNTTKIVVASPPTESPSNFQSFVPTPETIAFLQHSSGTTGLKKGVMLSHGAVLRQIEDYAKAVQTTESDVVVSWLPLYHDMGLVACFIMPIVLGQTVVLLDPFHWVSRPAALFRAITDHSATLCWLPNFAFEHLVNLVRPDPTIMNLRSMRAFINCSELCRPRSFFRFVERFSSIGANPAMLQTCYAMAETVFAVSQTTLCDPPRVIAVDRHALQHDHRAVAATTHQPSIALISNGRPLSGASVSIRNTDGHDLEDRQVGEVWVSAEYLFSGYFRRPDLAAERIRDGAFRTSDRGVIIDGEIYVLGRIDDLLILNGRNFHATEVEDIISEIEGFKPGRSVAFSIYNDEVGTNGLVLVCEIAGGSDEIRTRVRNRIFQELGIYPSDVALVEPGWLIKTTSGKIARGANAEKYERLKRPGLDVTLAYDDTKL